MKRGGAEDLDVEGAHPENAPRRLPGQREPRNEDVLDRLVPLHALAQDDRALAEFRVGQPGGLVLERADRPDDRREVVGRLRGRFAAEPAQKLSELSRRHRADCPSLAPVRPGAGWPDRHLLSVK